MKKVNITLEYDEKLPEFSENIFKKILYSGSYVDKNKIKVVDFSSDNKNNLKLCESCKSAFYQTNIIDDNEPILCDICYNYFAGE